jgi:hypothetical protein
MRLYGIALAETKTGPPRLRSLLPFQYNDPGSSRPSGGKTVIRTWSSTNFGQASYFPLGVPRCL